MSGPWEDFKASSTQVEAGPWDDFSPKEEPTEKNMRGERVSQFYKDVGQGALETAGALGSNLALTIPAGLAGLANLPSGIDAAVEAIDKVYGMGYQPKTEVGKRGTENVGKALNLIPEIMGEGGEFWAGNEGKLAGEIYGNFVTDLLPLRAIKAPKWKSKSAAKVEPKLNELEKELDKLTKKDESNPATGKVDNTYFVDENGIALRQDDLVNVELAKKQQAADAQKRQLTVDKLPEEVRLAQEALNKQDVLDLEITDRIPDPNQLELPFTNDVVDRMSKNQIDSADQLDLFEHKTPDVLDPKQQQQEDLFNSRPQTDERVQQRRAQEAAKAEQEAQLAELEQQLRESAYTPQGDLQGPKTRAWKSKEIGKRGLANSQTGAFNPEVFTFGMRGITRKLSELTDKLGNDPTWKISIRGALGGHEPLKNPDGTPMVMLHGTTAEINGKLRGSNQGFHAGYGPDANFFTQKANGEGKRSYLNTREQRSNAQMYPIVIKDGVYPTIKADAGDWSPKEILRPDRDSSKPIRDYISDALRRTGYTDTQIEGFYNYVNNQRGVSATNQAFTDVLKRAGIDGFFYENKAESPKTDKLFRMLGRDDIPARRDFVRNEVNHPKSFVTWSDRNFTSVYAGKGTTNVDRTQKPIGQRGLANSQTGAIMLPFGRKPAVDQLKKIEGIKNDPQLRNIFPEQLSVEEVIKEHAARKTPDVDQNFMQKAINHLTKGSLYQAIKTDNPIIRVVGEKIRQANNAAMEATGRLVHDGLAPLARDLSKQEKADVWAVQQMAEAKGVTLTPDFLQKQGFNQKQIDWVMEHKSVMDDMYQRMSDSMRAAGLEPVSPRVAYLASRARGDFRRLVMKDDKVVGIMGDNTRMGLNKQIERLKKDHPEYQIGEERYYGGRAAKGSDEGLMSLMDFLSKDNPDFRVFVDHVNDMLTQDAFQYMNAKSHTMQKKGVFGMEGRKVYADAVKNAQEGMQAQIRYAETMIKWSELSKAIAEVKPLLKADNGLDMPNAKEWANQYIQGALGNSPHKLGEFLDAATASLGKSTGIGTTIPTRAVSAMKSYVNGILLGFVNAGFLTANALQLPRTMPEMAAWLNSKGIEAGYDLGLGRALVTIEKSVTGQKLSALEKGAFEYAKKNHVYSSNLFESGNTVNKGLSYYWQKGTQMIASPLERETRKAAFFAYVHMLDETGFKPSDGLYEAAQNLTDMHMNNYSQAEAPRVYQETGSVGRSAYNLMSFKHNELSRLAMFAREFPKGQFSPALVAMGSQIVFAGLLGTIGFQEADKLFEYITGKMGKPTSMTKLLLDNPEIWDFAKFGVGSWADVDLTSRMGLQIAPDSWLDLAAPGFSKLGDIAGATYELGKDPNLYNVANLTREVLPLSVGGIMDRTIFERTDKTTGESKAINRNKVTASAVRNDADKLWKALGMTGVNESVQKKLSYENQKIDQVYKDKRSKVIDGAIKEYYMRGVLPDSWVKDFVELQGDPKDAIRAINDRIESLNVDRPTKEIMKNAASKSVTSQHKLLRRLGQE